jgi:hypothetical protein
VQAISLRGDTGLTPVFDIVFRVGVLRHRPTLAADSRKAARWGGLPCPSMRCRN